jgi:AraC-like DNA-binding protein
LWYCRIPQTSQGRERVLPNGCIQIVVNLARDYLTGCSEDGAVERQLAHAIIAGARARFEVIDTADMAELVGVVIAPGGFAKLFRERADLLYEQSVALDGVWPERELTERLCEAPSPAQKLSTLDVLLQRRVCERMSRTPLVDVAIRLLGHRGLSVAECARQAGVSERRLSQVFREEVGLQPKMWWRIQRFQAATSDLYAGADLRWAELALQCGYYDQSHFINDFRSFSGINPGTYSQLRGRWQNHVALR